MGVLHELLAAESALRETAKTTFQQVRSLFTSGGDRLRGLTKVYYPEEEEGQKFPDERVECATTVETELAKLARDYGAWIDASIQKEVTNTQAEAELEVDGTSFGTFPATALLNLENKLEEIIALYGAVPVLDPAVPWQKDNNSPLWRSPVEVRTKGEKRQEVIVLYPHTPEHPAQTQLVTKDVRVGRYETTVFSGALAQTDGVARFTRAKNLLIAVKRARARANGEKTDNTQIAEKIFAYINGS